MLALLGTVPVYPRIVGLPAHRDDVLPAVAVEIGGGQRLGTGGGGVDLAGSASIFRSTTCDWGASVGTNNRPADVQYGSTNYNKGDNASFVCRGGSCI